MARFSASGNWEDHVIEDVERSVRRSERDRRRNAQRRADEAEGKSGDAQFGADGRGKGRRGMESHPGLMRSVTLTPEQMKASEALLSDGASDLTKLGYGEDLTIRIGIRMSPKIQVIVTVARNKVSAELFDDARIGATAKVINHGTVCQTYMFDYDGAQYDVVVYPPRTAAVQYEQDYGRYGDEGDRRSRRGNRVTR